MKSLTVIIGAVAIIMIVGGHYYLTKDSPVVLPGVVSFDTKIETKERQPQEGWQEYRNGNYNFSLFYPSGLEVVEYQEGSNATTITFQDTDKGLGFQIFVVPYSGRQISEERFRKDVPSGVRTNLKNITIDGVYATSFSSKDVFLGETQEIWFISNGFLYEVTTPQTLGQWLSEIILTWQFF